MRLAILIMAAGKGTRLNSKRAKVLHEIGGRPLLRHVIDAACQVVSPHDIFVIVGHQSEAVEDAVRSTNVRFIRQEEQRGTGHAVQCAERPMREYDQIIVLSGDVPLLRAETIVALRDFHLREKAAMSILTATPEEPIGYGRIVRKSTKSAEVTAIVEQKSLTASQESLREINSGIYAFDRAVLYANLGRLRADNAHQELYLTDMAGILVKARQRVVALPTPLANEVLGANTITEMMELDRKLRLRIVRRLMSQGVTIMRPGTVTIDVGVEIGPDTIIEPFVQLLGDTRIGSDCRIRSYSVIENAAVADRVLIRNSCVIAESRIEKGAQLGPFVHLRPGCVIGEDAHMGNFTEGKKLRLGAGSKANHLSYLGDAQVGSGVNIGAGTITCNYDGVDKHETLIHDRVFIGSDSALVAPIVIGEGAYIAAGSVITDNVPGDALAIGRARQVNKSHWATNRRAQREARKPTSQQTAPPPDRS